MPDGSQHDPLVERLVGRANADRLAAFAKGKGGGKGGSTGGHVPSESQNTLQSKSTARFIDLLCEGPILGLVKGAESINFDYTPLMNEDGTYNFDAVNWVTRLGYPDQTFLAGFEEVESEETVGAQVKQYTNSQEFTAAASDICTSVSHGLSTGNGPFQVDTLGVLPPGLSLLTDYWVHVNDADHFLFAISSGNSTSGPYVNITGPGSGIHTFGAVTGGVVRQISDDEITRLRVALRMPALSYQNPTTGDLVGTVLRFIIDVQPNGGSYKPVRQMKKFESFVTSTGPTATGLDVVAKYDPANPNDASEKWSILVEYKLVSSGTWLEMGKASGVANRVQVIGGRDGGGTSYIKPVTRHYSVMDLTEGDYEVRVSKFNVKNQGVGGTSLPPGTVSIITKKGYVTKDYIELNDKATSPAEVQYDFDLPVGGAPWNVRVRRVTPDSTRVNLNNQLFWSSYTKLIDAKVSYSDSAVIGIEIDAQQFAGRVPRRSYEIYGLNNISVPDNYDPESRVYDGVWSGTFTTAYTTNAVWFLYTLLTNRRWGLGKYLDSSAIDKWSFYEVAKYSDVFVDDGFGGLEPRFEANGILNKFEDAYNVLQAIASIFRGMMYYATGTVFVSADMPGTPARAIVPADTVNGKFNYSGTGLLARHTVALVSWNDPVDHYRPTIEVVQNAALVRKYGWRPVNVAIPLCTSRGQARRHAKMILDTEEHETELCDWAVAVDNLDLMPGLLVDIADPNYMGVRWGGRSPSATATHIVLDAAVTLEAGETYQLGLVMADGKLEYQTVTNGQGTYTELDVAAPYSGAYLGDNILQSAYELDNSVVWTRTQLNTVTPNAANAADGTARADKIVANTVSAQHYITQRYDRNTNVSQIFELVFDVDPAEYTACQLTISQVDGASGAALGVNLSTQAMSPSTFGSGYTIISNSVLDLGGGIYRCTLRALVPSGQAIGTCALKPQNPYGTTSFVGDNSSGIYASNAQLYHVRPCVPGAVWILKGTNLSPRQFRILALSEIDKLTAKAVAIFNDAAKYDRVEQGIVLAEPNYTLMTTGPMAPPTALGFTEYLYRAGPSVKSAATLSWTAAADPRVQIYEVATRRAGAGNYTTIGFTNQPRVEVLDTTEGSWGFRVRAIDGHKRLFSPWATLDPAIIAGLAGKPADVTGFSVSVIAGAMQLVWQPVTDLDLDHYRIKYSTLTTGVTWGSSTDYSPNVKDVTVKLPMVVGTYLIKAVDTSGNESVNAASVVTPIDEQSNLNIVQTITEHTAFTGTKTNCTVVSSTLRLTALDTNIAQSDLDTSPNSGAPVASALYVSATTVDLGDVYNNRVIATLDAIGIDTGNVMSNWVTLASVAALQQTEPTEWKVILQLRTTRDNPAGSPTWTAWKDFVTGDYTFRGAQFRAIILSYVANTNAAIRGLVFTVDMPDRTLGNKNVASNSGADTNITYSPAFKDEPVLQVTPANMGSGDYYTATSKSRTGFTINFFNAAATRVSRNFDWTATGYGTVT